MAEKLTEQQVADLLSVLRSDASVDAKVHHVTAAKSSIKQHNVPDACVATLFDALRMATNAQHAVLVNAGFTSLNHLLTRLSRQEPKYLVKEATRTLPLIVDKMGDQKEKFRSLATQALTTLYQAAPLEVERSVRNTAMVGKNPRAKEVGMEWVLQMHHENGLQFRTYVPVLMDLLEDADGMVRDAAKTTVIELFRNAPNGAKSDLKKQLKNFKVRPAIEQAIVKELAPSTASVLATASDPVTRPESARSVRPQLGASLSSMSERPITPMPAETGPDPVDPSYVNTTRELDDIFKDMHIWFEGKETEQNWLKREQSMTKLRALIAGNAVTDFQPAFIAGCRALLDGIIKAVNSLRTSLSKEGCSFVQDLTNSCGSAIDPMVELLMQTFIKLCAATKKIASQQANVTVDTIIGKATYNARIMQHVWSACQDKNVQPRTYATGWVKTILKKEAHHKQHIEHTGGLELIEKCIKKGLNDANPGVRERMRPTYWFFAGLWPARAEAIMDTLDSTAQKLLQKDPNNPKSPPKRVETATVRPGLGLSKSTMGGSKPSLRETVLAQKKALASKTLPARPGSAMAHFSPVRTASNTSTKSSSSSAAPAQPVRKRGEGTVGVGGGGLSVAPMRPTRRRPEMAARPATAGPYSVRTHDEPSSEQASPPERPKTKAVTPRVAMAGSPKRTAQRTRPGHVATASEGSLPTPSKLTQGPRTVASPKAAPSPRDSPARPFKPAPRAVEMSSPTQPEENLTLVVPTLANIKDSPPKEASPSPPPSPAPVVEVEESQAATPQPAKPILELEEATTPQETPSRTLKVYEDPFTAEDQPTPKPVIAGNVLEDRPVNEDAGNLARNVEVVADETRNGVASPEKVKQNSRLLDSGIAKVKSQSLDVHGFRKLQGILRDSTKTPIADDKFDALLTGLFDYLESPLEDLAPEKVQDVKAQILATVRLLLKKARDRFQPHVSRGLESLLAARASYDARTHIVSGLELLADELVTLGDASEIAHVLSARMQKMPPAAARGDDARGARSLSMGLHVLREMIEARPGWQPSEAELGMLGQLAGRCLESQESGVRMDAVQLCVALHGRVGDGLFWEVIKGVKDDPKSLITYYIVKRQRERDTARA